MREYIENLNHFIENYWDYVINGTEHICTMMDEEDYYERYDIYYDKYCEHDESNLSKERKIQGLAGLVESIYRILPLLSENDSSFIPADFKYNFQRIAWFIQYYYYEEKLTEYEKNCNSYNEYFNFFSSLITRHELYRLEHKREKRDIEYLQKETDFHKIYHHYHFELEETLFGENWFEESKINSIKEKEDCEKNNYEDAYRHISVLEQKKEKKHKQRYINKLERYQRKIENLSKSIKLNPNNALAYYGRAYYYEEIGEDEKAIADLNKSIELDPNYFQAYCNRGCSYGNIGEYEKAIADCDKAIELAPNDSPSYCNRGCYYNKVGEYEKAIADCDKVIELDPNNCIPYYNRGNSYYALGEYEKAISDYTKALALYPKDKKAYEDRAKVYRLLGEIDKAIADEEKASKL